MAVAVKVRESHPRPSEAGPDPLGRTGPFGYDPEGSMSEAEIFEGARGCWAFGPRAHREETMLVLHRGTVVAVGRIDRLVRAQETDGKRLWAVEGEALPAGNPTRDAWFGKTVKVPGQQAVRYLDTGVLRSCRCGCGEQPKTAEAMFAAGHDTTAVRERVAKIGTAAEFCDWFDALDPPD